MTDCHDPDLHYTFGIDLFIRGVQATAGTPNSRMPRTRKD